MHKGEFQPELLRDLQQYRLQVEEAVGNVEGDHAVGLHVPQVHLDRLDRDQVHRDRVARERVHREHVESLRCFPLEIQARVADRHLDLRVRLGEELEFLARDALDRRVDLVEAVDVVAVAVGGDGPRAQADDADPDRLASQRQQREPDARRGLVVGGRRLAELGREPLLAVQDRPMHQRAVAAVGLAFAGVQLLHPQHAVEIALDQDRVLGELLDPVHQRADGEEQRGHQRGDDCRVVPGVQVEREEGDHHQRDLQLEVAGQRQRGDDAHQHAAGDAAERDDQVEERQVIRGRAHARQLAMAEHAREEQARGKGGDIPVQLEMPALVGKEPCHDAERGDEEG